jgi:hypothetical protein
MYTSPTKQSFCRTNLLIAAREMLLQR